MVHVVRHRWAVALVVLAAVAAAVALAVYLGTANGGSGGQDNVFSGSYTVPLPAEAK